MRNRIDRIFLWFCRKMLVRHGWHKNGLMWTCKLKTGTVLNTWEADAVRRTFEQISQS